MPYLAEYDAYGYPDYGFGLRMDGTYKGPGFFPGINANGDVVTEYSAGLPPFQYPLMYANQPPEHRQAVLDHSAGLFVDPWVWRDVQGSSLISAMRRALQGVSPFYDPAHDGAPRIPVYGNFGVDQ